MSSSQHPVAYRLEQQVGGTTKLLATVMGLPLVDGIFPAMVLSGALDSWFGILQVGLLVFGGSATVAVILAEMGGTPRQQARSVLAVGVGIVAVAALEAAFAPTIESVLNMAVFERFAALVIAAIAAKTASARVGEYLPSPGVIVGLGMLASLQPAGFELVTSPGTTRIVHAVAAAGVGVAFALIVALLSPYLREAVHIDRFRFGSAVALGILPLTILEIVETNAPLALAVLGVAAVLALDPAERAGDEHADETTAAADPDDATPANHAGDAQQTVTDGGHSDDSALDASSLDESSPTAAGDENAASKDDASTAYGYPGEQDGERRPWL